MSETCKDCRWSKYQGTPVYVLCRRFPPNERGTFSAPKPTDHCGEFTPLPKDPDHG